MLLDNYVELQPGVPKRLHFVSHALVRKEITDPLTKTLKTITTLVFAVDREDGIPVSKTFSVTAERLAQMLQPHLAEERYRGLDFIIARVGEGFQTRYSIRVELALFSS